MVNLKPLAVICVLSFVAITTVMGQNTGSGREMSVEESYLQESNEVRIIREQARGDTEEQKLLALEFISDAISRGNDGEEIRATLEYLGSEGTVSIARENGRIVNNHPLVRKQAVEYLGELGTPEAKDALIRIVRADNESMVLAAAFKALAKIGINEKDETVNQISTIVRHYNALVSSKPDEYLVYAALEAYEQLAEASGGIKDQYTLGVIGDIMVGPYQKKVRDRARDLLTKLFSGNGSQSSQANGR